MKLMGVNKIIACDRVHTQARPAHVQQFPKIIQNINYCYLFVRLQLHAHRSYYCGAAFRELRNTRSVDTITLGLE